jgi:hypothetical protein
MRKLIAVCAVLLLGLAVLATVGRSQMDKSKPLSPRAKAEFKFADGKTIAIDYSSPRMRGRKVYGDLVPFGKVWRVGANEATTFVTDANLIVGDKGVPAGAYTLFAIPDQNKWTLIISKKTGEWGIPYPGEQYDLARVDMKVSELPSPLEDLTITFEKAGTGCTLNLDWATVRASVDIFGKM